MALEKTSHKPSYKMEMYHRLNIRINISLEDHVYSETGNIYLM